MEMYYKQGRPISAHYSASKSASARADAEAHVQVNGMIHQSGPKPSYKAAPRDRLLITHLAIKPVWRRTRHISSLTE